MTMRSNRYRLPNPTTFSLMLQEERLHLSTSIPDPFMLHMTYRIINHQIAITPSSTEGESYTWPHENERSHSKI
ncbi:hypothetical protein CY34DRAFT_803332 [Suillus luteus UH-Slu-Lm8-n1]|uniref:Uncharacterized protein n=1 Tax=Suillus luteus UH-Slu-Lm8-n1 TaxID=930992 RepID=A0A0D0AQ70_9AGAM|nr:hypothetical protein CY34DRAFT_803332 [Suillus luteus UH-Slu-Lm8-n1]